MLIIMVMLTCISKAIGSWFVCLWGATASICYVEGKAIFPFKTNVHCWYQNTDLAFCRYPQCATLTHPTLPSIPYQRFHFLTNIANNDATIVCLCIDSNPKCSTQRLCSDKCAKAITDSMHALKAMSSNWKLLPTEIPSRLTNTSRRTSVTFYNDAIPFVKTTEHGNNNTVDSRRAESTHPLPKR